MFVILHDLFFPFEQIEDCFFKYKPGLITIARTLENVEGSKLVQLLRRLAHPTIIVLDIVPLPKVATTKEE